MPIASYQYILNLIDQYNIIDVANLAVFAKVKAIDKLVLKESDPAIPYIQQVAETINWSLMWKQFWIYRPWPVNFRESLYLFVHQVPLTNYDFMLKYRKPVQYAECFFCGFNE